MGHAVRHIRTRAPLPSGPGERPDAAKTFERRIKFLEYLFGLRAMFFKDVRCEATRKLLAEVQGALASR